MLLVSQSKEHVIEIDLFKKTTGQPMFFERETITKVKHVRDHVDKCSEQANDMHYRCVVCNYSFEMCIVSQAEMPQNCKT